MSIVVSHLTYTYGARPAPALRDVSVTFKAGELTLIAGASGCGKTTLIRCINGLIPRSYTQGRLEGAVSLFGQVNAGMPLAKISQLVGTVLQDPERQIVASKVVNEIAFGLENLGLPRQHILDRIQEAAQLLKIEYLLDRDTHRLSGGEKQKVALAGVLAMRPQALLLDEPLASLDPASGHEALRLMRRLADSGIAVVVIEHRVEDVLAVRPDRCVYMRDGAIAYDGDSEGLEQAVDWREIKLPAPVIIARVRMERRREARSKRREARSQKQEVGSREAQHSALSTQHHPRFSNSRAFAFVTTTGLKCCMTLPWPSAPAT